jgi:hypothetical protein
MKNVFVVANAAFALLVCSVVAAHPMAENFDTVEIGSNSRCWISKPETYGVRGIGRRGQTVSVRMSPHEYSYDGANLVNNKYLAVVPTFFKEDVGGDAGSFIQFNYDEGIAVFQIHSDIVYNIIYRSEIDQRHIYEGVMTVCVH